MQVRMDIDKCMDKRINKSMDENMDLDKRMDKCVWISKRAWTSSHGWLEKKHNYQRTFMEGTREEHNKKRR